MSLYEDYKNKIREKLMKELKYSSIMASPRPLKVSINIGLGEGKDNPKAFEVMETGLVAITGQKPIKTRAKKDISSFKVRKGNLIGLAVTLRGQRMWDFLDRFSKMALPRVRDFYGLNPKGFDGKGNYTLAIMEHVTFPEIDSAAIDKVRGMQVTIHTSAVDDTAGLALMKALGFPFLN
jgi:large subunit ribosomal protein L5